ncbi:GrpB family protein [soil metagenome]
MTDEVVVVSWRSAWEQAFASERDRIERILGDRVIAIEHIGSTAVPGLAAKPVIDLLCGFRTYADAVAAVPLLVADGWDLPADINARIEDRRFLKRVKDDVRTHHAHLIEFGSPLWDEYVFFRDALREDPAVRDEYESLKRKLAEKFRDQRDSYTASKGDFVKRVVAERRKAKTIPPP